MNHFLDRDIALISTYTCNFKQGLRVYTCVCFYERQILKNGRKYMHCVIVILLTLIHYNPM